jgi:hypothetical protein
MKDQKINIILGTPIELINVERVLSEHGFDLSDDIMELCNQLKPPRTYVVTDAQDENNTEMDTIAETELDVLETAWNALVDVATNENDEMEILSRTESPDQDDGVINEKIHETDVATTDEVKKDDTMTIETPHSEKSDDEHGPNDGASVCIPSPDNDSESQSMDEEEELDAQKQIKTAVEQIEMDTDDKPENSSDDLSESDFEDPGYGRFRSSSESSSEESDGEDLMKNDKNVVFDARDIKLQRLEDMLDRECGPLKIKGPDGMEHDFINDRVEKATKMDIKVIGDVIAEKKMIQSKEEKKAKKDALTGYGAAVRLKKTTKHLERVLSQYNEEKKTKKNADTQVTEQKKTAEGERPQKRKRIVKLADKEDTSVGLTDEQLKKFGNYILWVKKMASENKTYHSMENYITKHPESDYAIGKEAKIVLAEDAIKFTGNILGILNAEKYGFAKKSVMRHLFDIGMLPIMEVYAITGPQETVIDIFGNKLPSSEAILLCSKQRMAEDRYIYCAIVPTNIANFLRYLHCYIVPWTTITEEDREDFPFKWRKARAYSFSFLKTFEDSCM